MLKFLDHHRVRLPNCFVFLFQASISIIPISRALSAVVFTLKFYLDPAPRDVRVVRINDTAIQVFWTSIYHPPVARYIVHYSDKAENKPENQWSLFSPPNHHSATSAVISGLKADAMYNVRVSAEFSSANSNDPSFISGTARREGDLSEIHVADIYRRKLAGFSSLSDSRDRKRIFLFVLCLFASINQSREGCGRSSASHGGRQGIVYSNSYCKTKRSRLDISERNEKKRSPAKEFSSL
jgi:hypothetical protein